MSEKLGPRNRMNVRDFIFNYGFLIVLILVIAYFSFASKEFFAWDTLFVVLHSAAPFLVLASGLAFVLMIAQIDISVGSVVYLSSALGAMMISRLNVPALVGILAIPILGALMGAITGFIVTRLHVNPLIASLGMLMALRGIGLQLTNSFVISLPDSLRFIGNARLGPVYVDTIVSLLVLFLVYLLHTRTSFGRHCMAIGNGREVAAKLGIKVNRTMFLAFVMSGLMASLSGIQQMFQIGAVTPTTGQGQEFTAIAMLVIGGVSLFGGEGSILPGILLGGITLIVIEAGLNFINASVYIYPFVRGGIIFIAMFADTLKTRVKPQVQVMEESAIQADALAGD